MEATHKVPFEFDEGVVDLIVSRCTETESGGRMIDAILTNTLLPDMSREFLTRMLEGKPLAGYVSVAATTSSTTTSPRPSDNRRHAEQ